jgi:hypothetical protein
VAAVALAGSTFALVQEEFDCSIVDLEPDLADFG